MTRQRKPLLGFTPQEHRISALPSTLAGILVLIITVVNGFIASPVVGDAPVLREVRSPSSSFLLRLKVMQGDFGRAVEAYRNNGRSSSH